MIKKNFPLLLLVFLLPLVSTANENLCKEIFFSSRLSGSTQPEKAVSEIFALAGIKVNGPDTADISVSDPRFFSRLISDPYLELGETYMDGMWDSQALDQLAYKLMAKANEIGPLRGFKSLWRTPRLAAIALMKTGYRYFRDSIFNRQTRRRANTVAKEHYDVGNELYRQMLDPTLTYTSGIWAPGFNLEDAQNAKYDLICRKLNLKPGQNVLDIGSGFGGFARFAAKHYGAKVTGITISVEQLKAAKALSVGYQGVEFVFSDYRDIVWRFPPNTFDHVVSIEMIEAVGVKNLKTYFESAASALKQGGRFVIQAISENHDVVSANPWFSKYIFHDGVTPSTNQVDRAALSYFGKVADRQRITSDYDKTLMIWHDNFTRAWPELREIYSDRFKRMWDFYLLSVAGGFRAQSLQLDQTVYIKGGTSSGIEIVRNLPSVQTLKAMRLSDAEIAGTKTIIGSLEVDKRAIEDAIVPRSRLPVLPLAKKARIAVIGAGPGGLSAALELKKLGYENVVVYEKSSEAGGKSHTIEYSGRPHDLGATMGVRFKYAEIERLANQQNQVSVPFPKQIQYDLQSGGPSKNPTLLEKANLGFQALVYIIKHARTAGADGRGFEVPGSEFADPWSVVMSRSNLGQLGDVMKTYLTGYGYGGPDTPAVYGQRMMDVNAIIGSALFNPIMWEKGTQPIWMGLAQDLQVRTSIEVQRVDRSEDRVRLYLKGQNLPEEFDRVVMAVDPQSVLKILDVTAEERNLFAQVRYMPYSTFAVRVTGFSEGKAEVGYLRENMALDRMGYPMAWIKRYPDDNLFIFHLFAPAAISDQQIMANITSDLQQLGATRLTLVDSRRWPFFPHVDSSAMREGKFFERSANLQGLNNTVFVNEAIGMSTMPDAADLGRKIADRLASGEYGP